MLTLDSLDVRELLSQVWALEVQPSVGWNHRTFDPPLHFERLRLLGPQGLGAGETLEHSVRFFVGVAPLSEGPKNFGEDMQKKDHCDGKDRLQEAAGCGRSP